MDIIKSLIGELKHAGAQISVDGENLIIDVERGRLSERLQNLIKNHKKEIIRYVATVRQNHFTIPLTQTSQLGYPLSSSQKRLWTLSQFEDTATAYNITEVFNIDGELNRYALNAAFDELLRRHEILRTVFRVNNQKDVFQFILPVEDVSFKVIYHDFTLKKDQTDIKNSIEAERRHTFNLEKGPLLRVVFFELSEKKFVMIYSMHHIITDGWSMEIFIKELFIYYNAFSKGNIPSLEPIGIQYKDYASWQQRQLNNGLLFEQKKYWLKMLDGELPIIDMPSDLPRPAFKTSNGNLVSSKISPDLISGIKSLCQEQGGSLFMGLLTVVNILLFRYTGQEDIIIGTPISGRGNAQLENQIGLYLNTLALRLQFKGNETFKDILSKAIEVTLGAYENEFYPFDELVNELTTKRDVSRNVIFDVMIALYEMGNDVEKKELISDNLKISGYTDDQGNFNLNKFDLIFNFTEDTSGGIYLSIEYYSDLYSTEFIQRLGGNFERLLQSILTYPDISVQELDFLGKEEQHNLLYELSGGDKIHEAKESVIELFEKKAFSIPENIAVICGDFEMTYESLNFKANQLSDYLTSNYFLKSNDLVGISLNRSEWMVISILAVLKSGASYVPIDVEHPIERIEYIKKDTNCKVIINDNELQSYIQNAEQYEKGNRAITTKPNDLAYVIYTSGTTGRPNGVMIEHHSLVDYALSFSNKFKLSSSDRVIQQANFSFDTHVEEIFPTLICGATLIMCKNGSGDIAELKSMIEKRDATVLSTTPLILNELNRLDISLNKLRLIISGGDVFTSSCVSNFLGYVQVFDSYGPTESTVCSTFFEVKKEDQKNVIGRPFTSRSIYILSEKNLLQPQGVIGEICIGGSGLSRGYLNKPELTSQKFISNPFQANEILFKTGDLGKWTSDGLLKFHGRTDSQVKIRGYRIELLEIEKCILTEPKISSAHVLTHSRVDGEKELIAYIVNEGFVDERELRKSLKRMLPFYMIPAHFVKLEKFPLTANGKLDYKGFPKVDDFVSETRNHLAPRNEVENTLVEMWKQILNLDEIGVNDNFFDIGGHSLRAAKCTMQIQKRFNVAIDLKSFFVSPTIEELAEKISNDIWLQKSIQDEQNNSYEEIKI